MKPKLRDKAYIAGGGGRGVGQEDKRRERRGQRDERGSQRDERGSQRDERGSQGDERRPHHRKSIICG